MSSIEDMNHARVLSMMLQLVMLGAFSYFSIKLISNVMDPTQSRKKDAQRKAQYLFKKLNINNLKLDEYEIQVASQLIDPNSINVTWKDICGLDYVINKIKSHVVLPMKLVASKQGPKSIRTPTGVLLYGPPGCGKTMLAKATAREAGARFINLDVSMLTDKWYGESQKFAKAVFTLARKIEPCIIFIDEIDTFLRSRGEHDHEATLMVKAQFMKLWDGLETESDSQVIVMGATNRPRDVDSAILRRMPAMYEINTPSRNERVDIINGLADHDSLAGDVDLNEVADMTDGFSGSDLRELCRAAGMIRLEEFSHRNPDFLSSLPTTGEYRGDPNQLRKVTNNDFTSVINQMNSNRNNLSSAIFTR